MVRRRAREIAIINGRSPQRCTRQDMLEAQRELTGAIPGLDDDEGRIVNNTSGAKNRGQAAILIEKEEIPDEQLVGEELIEQGINEAEHDQMVEAAKRRQIF